MRRKQTNSEVEQEISSYSLQHLSYSGEVTLSIVNNKKIILRKTFHNAGKENLFKFLATCLAGNYAIAKTLQPVKIRLYFNDWENAPSGETSVEKAQVNINKWQNIDERSNFVYYNTTGTVEKIEPEDEEGFPNYQAVLHFRIPFSYIKHGQTAEHSESVNQICIYADSSSEPKDFSASFLVTDEDGEMKELELKKEMDNYTLIVDWKMIIDNQKTN